MSADVSCIYDRLLQSFRKMKKTCCACLHTLRRVGEQSGPVESTDGDCSGPEDSLGGSSDHTTLPGPSHTSALHSASDLPVVAAGQQLLPQLLISAED